MYYIHYFKKLGSTNDRVKKFKKECSVVVAEIQTKGRGRFKRKWSSGKGGLWLSILLKPKNIGKLGYLTFSAAVACQRAVKKAAGIESKVKWPNDLVIGKKKLCGILTESGFGTKKFAVVGIGMNTNNKIPENLKENAISLSNILGKEVNNKELINCLLNEFELLYKKLNNREYNFILKEWKKLSDTLGRDVKVITRNKVLIGKAIDVDDDLRLIIKTANNTLDKVTEGDVLY